MGNFTSKTVNEGTTIRLNIIAADWNEDVITYTATNLPNGATVDSETHTFSWTPGYDQAGTYDITLIISDGQLQARALLNIIVINSNNVSNKPPVIGAIADASVNQKEIVTCQGHGIRSGWRSADIFCLQSPGGCNIRSGNPVVHLDTGIQPGRELCCYLQGNRWSSVSQP